MTTPAVSLTLTYPPRILSPNASSPGEWRPRAEAKAAYRNEVRVEALQYRRLAEKRGCTFPLEPPVAALLTVIMRRWNRDGDNVVAAFKSGFDGLVDAGLLADDSLKVLRPITVDAELGDKLALRVELWPSVARLDGRARR